MQAQRLWISRKAVLLNTGFRGYFRDILLNNRLKKVFDRLMPVTRYLFEIQDPTGTFIASKVVRQYIHTSIRNNMYNFKTTTFYIELHHLFVQINAVVQYKNC